MIEMFGLFIAVTCFSLVTDGRIFHPFSIPRDTFLCVSTWGLLGLWLWGSPGIHLEGGFLTLIPGLLIWWFACSVISPIPRIAMRNFCKFGLGLFLGVFVLGGIELTLLFQVFVAAATVNAAAAIVQGVFRVRIFKNIKARKINEPSGFIGNPNKLAAYLVPQFFMAIYLVDTISLLWAGPLTIILAALVLTRCRAALVGCLAASVACAFIYDWGGIFLAGFTLLGLLFPVSYMLPGTGKFKRLYSGSLHTLRERFNFWRVGWEQIKKTPLFGVGFNVFQARVPYLQRDINNSNGKKFLDPERYGTPWPKQAHSDPIQVVLDNGLVGLALIAAIFYTALARETGPAGEMVFVILTGALVNGVFFHTFHILPLNIVLWSLIGARMQTSMPSIVLDPGPLVWGLYAFAGILVYRFVGRRFLAAYYLDRFLRSNKKDRAALIKVLRLDPDSTIGNTQAGMYCWQKGEHTQAIRQLFKGVEHFDGEMVLWQLYTNLGNGYLHTGAHGLAKGAYNTALDLMPGYELAKIGLEHVRLIEEEGMKELQTNGKK